MDEYIRKADAIDILDDFQVGIENGEGNYSWAKFKMNELEPADVAPVRHARWRHYEGMYTCEACGAQLDDESPFCPMCGAKMDAHGPLCV